MGMGYQTETWEAGKVVYVRITKSHFFQISRWRVSLKNNETVEVNVYGTPTFWKICQKVFGKISPSERPPCGIAGIVEIVPTEFDFKIKGVNHDAGE